MKLIVYLSVASFCLLSVFGYQCGPQSLYTTDRGEIKSHVGYDLGHNYGRNLDCTWVIQAPPGKYVEVTAETFTLESRTNCPYDYLEFYDGNGTNTSNLGKFCGSQFNSLTSSGNTLTLHFVTNANSFYRGFKLFYNFTDHISNACHISGQYRCGNTKCVLQSYRCDSYDDCGDNTDEINCPPKTCRTNQWLCANQKCITASYQCDGDNDCGDKSDETGCAGGTAASHIAGFIPATTKTCRPGYWLCANQKCITSRYQCDGDNDCGDKSDETGCAGGTAASHLAGFVPATTCGTNITGSTNGSVVSPNYPGTYPDLSSCRTHIILPTGYHHLLLSWASGFSIEPATNCDYDYVKVYAAGSSNTQQGKYCGTVVPGPRTMNGTHFVVEFNSDTSDHFAGFRLNFNATV